MTSKKATEKAKDEVQQAEEKPECFIIMPIADRDGYEAGHFKRVYDWVVKPACEAAGYKPVRADDVSSSHLIVADILKRIVEAPMAICDISSLNANVMFELGIRQAFGKPVALIKDERTNSVFDISGLRYTEYTSSLRADLVESNVQKIADMINETQDGAGITSLMALVDLEAAQLPQQPQISDDSRLILQELHILSRRLDSLDSTRRRPPITLTRDEFQDYVIEHMTPGNREAFIKSSEMEKEKFINALRISSSSSEERLNDAISLLSAKIFSPEEV